MENLTPNDLHIIPFKKRVGDADDASTNVGMGDSFGGIGGPTFNQINEAIETAEAIAGGAQNARGLQALVFAPGTVVTPGDGAFYMHVDGRLSGLSLVDVHAEVITAGSGSATQIQIHNATQGMDMLSTRVSIDAAETGSDTAATTYVINLLTSVVTENDVLRIDIDGVASTPPRGLIVTLGFV